MSPNKSDNGGTEKRQYRTRQTARRSGGQIENDPLEKMGAISKDKVVEHGNRGARQRSTRVHSRSPIKIEQEAPATVKNKLQGDEQESRSKPPVPRHKRPVNHGCIVPKDPLIEVGYLIKEESEKRKANNQPCPRPRQFARRGGYQGSGGLTRDEVIGYFDEFYDRLMADRSPPGSPS